MSIVYKIRPQNICTEHYSPDNYCLLDCSTSVIDSLCTWASLNQFTQSWDTFSLYALKKSCFPMKMHTPMQGSRVSCLAHNSAFGKPIKSPIVNLIRNNNKNNNNKPVPSLLLILTQSGHSVSTFSKALKEHKLPL